MELQQQREAMRPNDCKPNRLVARLAAAHDQASGDAIRQQILDGFYGTKKPIV
jgi:hypothetical protein